MRVLLAEDSARLAHSLSTALREAGMVTDAVTDGLQAEQVLVTEDYDAVILDLALPRLDGLEVLRRARARGNDVPVLILTASGGTVDRVRGLNAGADDYLPKPFDLAELIARLRAIGRRRIGRAHAVFTLGPLSYDSVAQCFRLGGELLKLPPREHQVLEVLIAHTGRPVSKSALCGRLCTLDESITPDAIEIYVHRLRRRLPAGALQIRTLRGLGYLMEALDDATA
ncbi:MAG TPA: response regulator [Roseateles sp.]|nr:response regulator [Roseateles sp.]